MIHLAEVAKADRERCSNNGQVDDLAVDNDGFLLVNKRMMTSIPDIFAAGDCCSYHPTSSVTMGKSSSLAATVPIAAPHFFQMRLWTQARFLGTYAAQCMENVEDNYGTDQHLELFAHVTRFFGLKVVLLGRYNGQQCGALVEKAVKRTVFTSAVTVQGMNEQDSKAEAEAQYDATGIQWALLWFHHYSYSSKFQMCYNVKQMSTLRRKPVAHRKKANHRIERTLRFGLVSLLANNSLSWWFIEGN